MVFAVSREILGAFPPYQLTSSTQHFQNWTERVSKAVNNYPGTLYVVQAMSVLLPRGLRSGSEDFWLSCDAGHSGQMRSRTQGAAGRLESGL